jgi:hypothetical protein
MKLLEEIQKRVNFDASTYSGSNTIQKQVSNPQVASIDPDVEYRKNLATLAEIKRTVNNIKKLKNDYGFNYKDMFKIIPDTLKNALP